MVFSIEHLVDLPIAPLCAAVHNGPLLIVASRFFHENNPIRCHRGCSISLPGPLHAQCTHVARALWYTASVSGAEPYRSHTVSKESEHMWVRVLAAVLLTGSFLFASKILDRIPVQVVGQHSTAGGALIAEREI